MEAIFVMAGLFVIGLCAFIYGQTLDNKQKPAH